MTATIRPLRTPPNTRPMPLPQPEKDDRIAYVKGVDDGERMGHVNGWRTGMGHGLFYGFGLGMLCMFGLIKLGQMLGA